MLRRPRLSRLGAQKSAPTGAFEGDRADALGRRTIVEGARWASLPFQ
jgi:hypothetical protein